MRANTFFLSVLATTGFDFVTLVGFLAFFGASSVAVMRVTFLASATISSQINKSALADCQDQYSLQGVKSQYDIAGL